MGDAPGAFPELLFSGTPERGISHAHALAFGILVYSLSVSWQMELSETVEDFRVVDHERIHPYLRFKWEQSQCIFFETSRLTKAFGGLDRR